MADVETLLLEMGQKARKAARVISSADATAKDAALTRLAELLRSEKDAIQDANAKDLAAAEERGLDGPRMDRLRLTDQVVEDMAVACEEIAAMDDPVGAIESTWKRPGNMLVGRMRIPIGVIAMIYESRPNVTIDSGILCLKAGNAIILRGGSEAIHSNLALAGLLHKALESAGLPADCVQVVPTTDRAAVKAMLGLEQYIDVIIPRGGETLIRAVVQDATMPVLKHYMGVCHCYVDEESDLQQALDIVYNGKVQRPGVCNALECLLVHHKVADTFLPMVAERLGVGGGVTFRACPVSLPLLGETAQAATEDDWGHEFHDLILAVRVVANRMEAQDHIAAHGSNHTEVICTTNHATAMRFLREVDASLVAINASSRFNDGGQLGLGAEIGISTSKLHSYGVMGVRELTTTKFVILGDGQVRS